MNTDVSNIVHNFTAMMVNGNIVNNSIKGDIRDTVFCGVMIKGNVEILKGMFSPYGTLENCIKTHIVVDSVLDDTIDKATRNNVSVYTKG